MNYLSHYVYNHRVRGLPAEPYFALGVALPDLWPRFSRTRRIRWKSVRAAAPDDTPAIQLRAGLLNHVEADRRFHTLPLFLRWQRDIRRAVDDPASPPALLDFLAHMSIELELDVALLRDDPALIDEFYAVLGNADSAHAAALVGVLGAVDTTGLDGVIARFIQRRFLRHYTTPNGTLEVVQIVLSLAGIAPPPERIIRAMLAHAAQLADPRAVWTDMP